jgi:hypothetical protein
MPDTPLPDLPLDIAILIEKAYDARVARTLELSSPD